MPPATPAHIKEAASARFHKEQGESPDVMSWEQKEYLDLF